MKNDIYEFVLPSPAVSHMSCSYYLDGFKDRIWIVVQLFRGLLLTGFVQRPCDTNTSWKKSCFILSDITDFHMIDSLSIGVSTFVRRMLTLLSADEILLPRYMNLSTNFRGTSFRVKIAPSRLKHLYFVWFAFTWRPMPPTVCFRPYSWNSA